MTEASAEKIAVARSDLDRAISSAARVYRLARALSVSPTEAAFQEALRSAAPDVIECAARVSLAAAALGVATTGMPTSSSINGPWASDPPDVLVGRLAGTLRETIAGASGIGDAIEGQITEIDEHIAAIKRQAEELERLAKAMQALAAKVLDAIGTDRPAECGDVPVVTDEPLVGTDSALPAHVDHLGMAAPFTALDATAGPLGGEKPLAPIDASNAAQSGSAYPDPFDSPQPLEILPAQADALPLQPPAELAIPTVDVEYLPPTLTPLPLDQPPVSELVDELGIKSPSGQSWRADQPARPTGEGAFVGKIEGKVEAPPELKFAPAPTDPSELVGKFQPPTRDPGELKFAPPPTDPSELVGKFQPPTREQTQTDIPVPVAKQAEVPVPVAKQSAIPVPVAKQSAIPVPVAKRSGGGGSRSRWSWLLLPAVLLLAIVVIGVLAVGLGVFNNGLTAGEVKSPSPFTGDSTATPSASAVVGVSASPSSSVGASPSAAPTTQAPSPSATEPVPSGQPTPTPVKPTPTVAPTNSPKPTPTSTPPKGTTPPPVVSFKVTPQQVSTSCKDLAVFDISLNSSGSNVAVDWSIKFRSSSYSGDWGSAKPQSGTLDAGAVGSVTITPQADLCASLTSVEEFVLEVGYGGDSPETVTYRLTP